MPIEKLKPTFSLESERIEALKQIIPEAFADGKINWETLKELFAPNLEDESEDAEHFGLNWPGKRQARRLASMPSKGTLVPVPGEGVNEDTTQNIFIEGDNLEALKLLQKSYAGRIKMIYIDPPYNTGNDFIYKDDYSEPLESYLKRTGQADEEGKLLVSNTKADGRFHSNWLSMMYPRLTLAKTLLREDGVIFISIDDREVHNLRAMMNEMFGEENFLAAIVWQKRISPDNDERHITATHDYVICYSKNAESTPIKGFSRSSIQDDRYDNPDNDPRGPWTSSDLTRREYRERDFYKIKLPSGRYVEPSRGRSWSIPKENFDELVKDNRVWFGPDGDSMPRRKRFLSEVGERIVPVTWWSRELSSDNQTGKREVKSLFLEMNDVFENPKPLTLLKTIISISTKNDDFILDFFGGTGTTAHAIFEQNKIDSSSRRFIVVQIPEETKTPDFPTIASITKERIRRSIHKVQETEDNDIESGILEFDLGFKSYKLATSLFNAWRDVPSDADLQQMQLTFENQQSPLIEGWKESNVLTEILLLEGFPLHSKITKDETFNRNKVFRIESDFCAHRLFVSLDADIFEETIRQVTELPKEDVFICLDSGLSDTDKTTLDDNHLNSKTI